MNNDINEKIVHAAPVPPFVRFVASAVPMVFDNSLSYYEALCALWKWMQDNLVDVINHNATVTEQYIDYDLHTRELFIELKSYVDNYFDNLDVQEEINNKLDDMVEAGTLQEIITTYIQSNVAWTFDTVADMKQATNLVNGSYARTLGFHSVNDGGGAFYKITDSGTADEMYIIAIGDLRANLIIQDYITPEVLGAYGDNTHDDTTAVQACLSNTDYKHSVLSKTYKITSALSVPNYKIVDGGGAIYSSSTCFELDGIAHITIKDLQLYPQLHAIHITSTSSWSNYNLFENIFCNGSQSANSKGLFIETTNAYINEHVYRNCVFWNFQYGIYALNEEREMGSHRFLECSTELSKTEGQYIKNGNRFHFYDCRHAEAISCKWTTEGTCNGLLIEGGEVMFNTISNANLSETTNGKIIGGLRYSNIYADSPVRDANIVNGKVIPVPSAINTGRTNVTTDRTINYGDTLYLYYNFNSNTATHTLTLPEECYGGYGKINEFYVRTAKADYTSTVAIGSYSKTLPAGTKVYKFTLNTLGGNVVSWFVEEITSI